jgi:hypothetical protein
MAFNSRVNSIGDQKYKSPMVPGYTGFIPKGLIEIQGKSFEGLAIYGITKLEEKRGLLSKQTNNIPPLGLSAFFFNLCLIV